MRVRSFCVRWSACLALALAALGCAGKRATPRAATEEAWRARPPKPGAAGQVKYPAVHASQLENGLSVLVVQTHSGLVSTELVVRHGASSVARVSS
jgi:hypothetical protein